MKVVLLQTSLPDSEIDVLIQEFPQYMFLNMSPFSYKKLSLRDWSEIEIIFGDRLGEAELKNATGLRWIHSPSPNLNRLCLKEIKNQGNILITITKSEDIFQIGEFVTGAILAFSKNLFHWYESDHNPALLWDSKHRDTMWTLKGRTHLQIGLGQIGTEIARRAKLLEMKVHGVTQKATFNSSCDKIFEIKHLQKALPEADVVCIALPRGRDTDRWFDPSDLIKMKDGAILIIIGSRAIVDENVLVKIAEKDHLRGILIDAFYQLPISPKSKLWSIPNIIITPEVAMRPKSGEKEAFRDFRYNLRQYTYGNFSDLRNLEP